MGKTFTLGQYPNIGISSSGTPTTNYLPKFTGASTIGNSQIQDDGTSVGIGGSPNASYKLAVTGATTITGNLGVGGGANERLTITGPSGLAGMARWTDATTGSGFLGFTSGGTAYIHSNSNALAFGANGSNNFAATMTLTSGNVGIGTSSPSCTLEVARNNGGSTGGQIALRNSSSSTLNSRTEISFLNDTGASASGTRNGRIISQMDNVANGASNMQFWTWNGSADAERMRITSGGRVAIGRTVPGTALSVAGQSEQWQLAVSTDTGAGAVIGSPSANVLAFGDWSGTERMRITSGGYTKISSYGSYQSASGTYHEVISSTASNPISVFSNYATNPYGIEIGLQNADPNNASNYVFGAYAASPSFVWIYRIWSNGTISARSDARWKKNIETTRSGYLEDLCKLRVVKYNWYNHEENAPKELGLIAQEVEEVFPNLIQYDKVTTKKQVEQEDGTFIEQEVEDGESRSVKVSVLPFILLKALQEANAKIDELSAKVTALENK